MSIIENTWSFLASRGWNTWGVTYAVIACAITYFNDGNFWLELLSSTLIGAACFCFGANFQKHTSVCTCTCEEEGPDATVNITYRDISPHEAESIAKKAVDNYKIYGM